MAFLPATVFGISCTNWSIGASFTSCLLGSYRFFFHRKERDPENPEMGRLPAIADVWDAIYGLGFTVCIFIFLPEWMLPARVPIGLIHFFVSMMSLNSNHAHLSAMAAVLVWLFVDSSMIGFQLWMQYKDNYVFNMDRASLNEGDWPYIKLSALAAFWFTSGLRVIAACTAPIPHAKRKSVKSAPMMPQYVQQSQPPPGYSYFPTMQPQVQTYGYNYAGTAGPPQMQQPSPPVSIFITQGSDKPSGTGTATTNGNSQALVTRSGPHQSFTPRITKNKRL